MSNTEATPPEQEQTQSVQEKAQETTQKVTETTQKAQAAAGVAQQALTIFGNPYTWVAIVIAFILAAATLEGVSAYQVIGQNPNLCQTADECQPPEAEALAEGAALDASGIVKVATEIAWPDGRKVGGGSSGGRAESTPAYVSYKAKAEQLGGADGYLGGNLFASCDRFVATVMRVTVDPKYPWGPTATQAAYLASNPAKWKPRTGALQPGDVLITGGSGGSGHTLIILDNGRVAQASYFSYTATASDEAWAPSPSGNYTTPWDSRPYKAYYAVGADGAAASGSPREIGKTMAAQRGWTGSQWTCLEQLWTRESQWDPKAYNASSGATGIPQSLPGDKMASAGADWRTNPATQIKWGLGYIADRYGTPCGAWQHSESVGWY